MTSAKQAAPRSLGLIHTVPGLVPVFEALVAKHMPDWAPFNIVDESLLRNTIEAGELSATTFRRVAGHVWSALDAGAEAVLVTCSSIGPAVDAVAPMCSAPVLRVDVGMVDEALGVGGRIGVLATLSTTLQPTADLVSARAHVAGKNVQVIRHLCESAFALLQRGDRAGHDERVLAGASTLAEWCDVIILAQASMARALEAAGQGLRVPALSSPEAGVLRLKAMLT